MNFRWRMGQRLWHLGQMWRRSTAGGILRLSVVAVRAVSFRVGGSFYHWWMTKSLRYLLQGLPAVLVLLAIATLIFLVLVQPGWQLLEFYEQAGQQAYRAEQYTQAHICFERLGQLAPENKRFRFVLGQVVDKLGDQPRAAALIAQLAPRDQMGFAPAHLWEARRLLSIAPLTEVSRDAAEAHLLRLLQAEPNTPEAAAELAKLYLDSGRIAQAEKLLGQVGKSRPDLQLQLARLYAARGPAGEIRLRHIAKPCPALPSSSGAGRPGKRAPAPASRRG
jgi:tetratricopeptide (TPR) repeat protein